MVMGDFNADCTYLNSKEKANLALKKDPSYNWLINDSTDTTVAKSDCAYDRLVK